MQKKWIADAQSHKEDLNERLQSTLKKMNLSQRHTNTDDKDEQD